MRRRVLAVALAAALVGAALAGVATATPATPEFENGIESGTAGETVTVGVDVSGAASDTVRVTIGNQSETAFEVAATVTDADGDGSITVRLDTAAAGNGDPESYLTVGDGDVRNRTTEVAGFADGSEGLDPAGYELTLGPPADPHDVATLVLQAADGDGQGDETPTDDGVSTPPETHDGTSLDVPDGELRLQSAPRQRIAGETTLEPGTTLSIRVRSADAHAPFLRTVETTVADDGSFDATVDLRDVAANAPFEVTVWHDTRRLAWARGQVVACDGECPTSTAAPGDGTGTPTRLDPAEIDIESVVQVERSDVARIPVTFGDADTLTVSVGDSEASNYELNATVRDANGDGRAVLLFRTNATDDADRPTLLVEENGESRPANVSAETTLDAPVDPAPYPVDVFAGTAAAGSPDTVGTLVVLADSGDDGATGTAVPTTAGAPGGPNDGSDGTNATVAAPSENNFATGLGALALGGAIAIGGIALLLGVFRG